MNDPIFDQAPDESLAHMVHQAIRFLRVVWYRKHLLVLAVAAAALLGGLHYTTANRSYESESTILVVGPQRDTLGSPLTGGREDLSSMATYEKLLVTPLVLQSAVRFLDAPTCYGLGAQDPDILAGTILSSLSAKTIMNTNLITLRFRCDDPQVASSVLGGVIRAYSQFMHETHRGTADNLIEVLTKEKTELDEKLDAAEAEYLGIRQQVGDIGSQGDGKVVHPLVERAMQLNSALIDAQKKRLLAQAAHESLQQSLQGGQNIRESLLSLEESLGKDVFLESLGLGARNKETRLALEKQLLEDRAQLETLCEYFGDHHPKVVERRAKIAKVEEYLAQFDVLGSLKHNGRDESQVAQLVLQLLGQRVAAALKHEQWLAESFEQTKQESIGLSGQMARLDIVNHDIKWLRQLRSAILDQIAGVDLRQEQGGARVTVVREPTAPGSPVSPRLIMTLAFTLLGGIVAGLAGILIVDVLDDRIRSPEDLASQLGLNTLALVGDLESESVRSGDDGDGLETVHMWNASDDNASESFRTLRTVITMNGTDSQRLAVSSTEPGDGKTTISTNLAVAFHQAGKRVLLIDGDMRKPGLTKLVGFRAAPGLSDILRDSRPVAELAAALVQQSGSVPIDIISSGKRPTNPGELLLSDRFGELLAWGETVYDQIIVDAPPVLAGTDAAAIGRACEGLVMVIRHDKNRRRVIVRAVEVLRSLGARVHGLVINCVGIDSEAYGYGYGYGYGHRYGDDDEDRENGDYEGETGDLAADSETIPHPSLRRAAA